jgi:DUF4097 and DUF4098 domain-containing protein YvlB
MLFALLVMVMLSSGCVNPEEGVIRDTVDLDHLISDGGRVSIENENGNIQVGTTTGDRVLVEAEKASSAGEAQFDLVDVVFEDDGTDLLLKVVFEPEARGISVNLDVQVPDTARVVLVSSDNGNIDLVGTRGNTTLTTLNGWVTVDGVQGFVEASSSNGRVEVLDTTGVGNVTTSNGDLRLDVRALAGNVTLSAFNGAVSLFVSPAVDADVVITTNNGNIDFHDTVLDTTLVEAKRVEGTVGDGGTDLMVTTTNGDVYFYELL